MHPRGALAVTFPLPFFAGLRFVEGTFAGEALNPMDARVQMLALVEVMHHANAAISCRANLRCAPAACMASLTGRG